MKDNVSKTEKQFKPRQLKVYLLDLPFSDSLVFSYRVKQAKHSNKPSVRKVARWLGFDPMTVWRADQRLKSMKLLDDDLNPLEPANARKYGDATTDWTSCTRYYLLKIPKDKNQLKAMAIFGIRRGLKSGHWTIAYGSKLLRLKPATVKASSKWISDNFDAIQFSPETVLEAKGTILKTKRPERKIVEYEYGADDAQHIYNYSRKSGLSRTDSDKAVKLCAKNGMPFFSAVHKQTSFMRIYDHWKASHNYDRYGPRFGHMILKSLAEDFQMFTAPTPEPILQIKPDQPTSQVRTYLSERTIAGQIWECEIDRETDIPIRTVRRIAV